MPQTPREDLSAWRELFSAVIDGQASADQSQQLRELLKSNSRAADEYLAYVDLHAVLSAVPTSASQPAVARPAKSFRRWRVTAQLAAAASVVGGLVLALLMLLGSPVSPVHATLVRSVGGDLLHFDHEVQVGEGIGQRTCHLTHGVIELRYHGGVQLVIEGPARFCCRSASTLVLYEGRLSAEVPPPATGFRVETPKMEVVDWGTKFGVDVSPEGASEVHVFQGKVSAKGSAEAAATKLVKGDSRRISDTGDAAASHFRNAAFVHPLELAALDRGLQSGQERRWRTAVEQLKADPGIVTYLGFDDPLVQPNIHSARRVQGRFPGVTALEFMNENDHVRLDIGGTYQELTMMAWVRLDNSPLGVNSLYHTDNWSRDGQVHWLVAEGRQMRFSLHRGGRDPLEFSAMQYWPESRSTIINDVGRWVHLTATYRASRQAIRFYINGEFDAEVIDPMIYDAVLGPAQIGNWKTDDASYPNRRLGGRMDEFVILRRVLADEEIAAFHDAGTPYSQEIQWAPDVAAR